MAEARRVVIAVFPDVDLLDVTGPAEVFALANRESGRAAYRVELAGRATGAVATSAGVRLLTDVAFAEVSGMIDTLIVPGAVDLGEAGPVARVDADVVAWVAAVAPSVAGEPVVVKTFPNAFHATKLEAILRELGAGPELILAGFMTHMCVTFTAQGAFNLGYRPTVVADATATRSLAGPDGTPVPAATLQAAALTTIGDLFGVVVPSVDALVRA